jgi:hypothetical protein
MSNTLIQTLDALANERHKVINMKKKHLHMEGKNSNIHEEIEWMRINAERERISLYKDVA